MSVSTTSHLNSIQALRGIAALGVAFLHLTGLQTLEGLRDNAGIFTFGWMGVDLFFIVSGFIMVWVTADIRSNPKSASLFMASRCVRIYPLWWVCVTLVALFFLLVHGVPASLDLIPRDQAWGYYFRSFILWPQKLAPLLDVGWTLIHEMFFYIVFALIIAVGLRKKLIWGLLAWSAFTAIGYHLNWAEINPFFSVIFSPLTFLFISGAFIGTLKNYEKLTALAWPIFGLSLLIILWLIYSDILDKSERVTHLIIPLTLLLWSVVTLERSNRLKVNGALTWLGDISYAFYLTHPIVILAWGTVRPFYKDGLFGSATSSLPAPVLLYIDMAALIVAFLVTATIFHVVIEKPALRFAKKKIPSYRK